MHKKICFTNRDFVMINKNNVVKQTMGVPQGGVLSLAHANDLKAVVSIQR